MQLIWYFCCVLWYVFMLWYVDICMIFNHKSHVERFLNYVNTYHPSISFTCEMGYGNQLPLLDTQIMKESSSLYTIVYRKPTFTGLGMKFQSSTSQNTKWIAFVLFKIKLLTSVQLGCYLNWNNILHQLFQSLVFKFLFYFYLVYNY